MKWFFNLKIAKKLLLSFSCVLLLTAILGIFSIVQLQKVNDASTEMATNWLPSIKTLGDIKLLLARLRSNESQMALYDEDQAAIDTLGKRTEEVVKDLNAALKLYETQISEPEERALYPEVQKRMAVLLAEHGKIVNLIYAKKVDDAKKIFLGASNNVYFELLRDFDKLTKVNADGSDTSLRDANATFLNARIWIVGILIGALAAGFMLAVFVARAIATPLTVAVGVAKQVAAGDLTAQIRPGSRDETGELMRSLKEMNDSLLNIVSQVRTGTETISTASGEIASGNLDLSSRTEQQAGSLEETASAMEELTSTVKQNADNARQANQLAVSASEVAIAGGIVVGKVVDTMGSINGSSRQIADIISVIDGIAFQTNILALNAAVEAARAGEQGRGFAVVASEVRNLAQRSAAAAKEIKALIDSSVAQVDLGSKLVEEAGNTMSDVVNSVKRVTDIVGEISSASQEQSDGIEQINKAITQMDEVTQQNAALVEEAAAAAQSLQHQAGRLTEVVSVFKLDSRGIAESTQAFPTSRRTVDITPRVHALPE
ncbi:methyl-accepting chemotaxis protein [Herbaspirillum sp. CF444]|uniref:methyl-accepting chemotaxis protein n=1 Tax=Herbaspirillum sp. CF444 TaxID=1144319 RepID=UPI0002727350|nr:methyl-accepting chemotaxis protein [Herbaspirillum sp. CF444]EJL93458.1 methyl-accepting chemotaxis protein [Herbaspirillum sp. CF444]